MKTQRMNAVSALRALGVDICAKGPIKKRVLVSQGDGKLKHYVCRLRKGTGHVTYRWGRLGFADVTDHGEAGSIAVFYRID